MATTGFSRLAKHLTHALSGLRTKQLRQLHKIEKICSPCLSNTTFPDFQIIRYLVGVLLGQQDSE